MGDHAVVGADRLALDVPSAVQDFERLGHPEPVTGQDLAELRGLDDGRQVRQDDPACAECARRVRHHVPRLGEVEHDPVETRLVDPLVAVADLDVVVRFELGTDERVHVLLRLRREVGPDLVAGDVRSGPQHRHRQRTRPDARFEDTRPREDVGQHEDGTEILRIDDLRAARHLEDELGQRGADRGVTRPAAGAHGDAFLVADQHIVSEEPGMGMELGLRLEGDQVAALLGIDEDDLLAHLQRAAHALTRSARGRPAACGPCANRCRHARPWPRASRPAAPSLPPCDRATPGPR